jgi:hypothetical protein
MTRLGSTRLLLVAGAAFGAMVTLGAQPTSLPRLLVDAVERERRDAWVAIQLPSSVRGTDLQLRAEDGTMLPLQIGPDREAWTVIPTVAADRRLAYTIEPAARPRVADRVAARRDGGHVVVERAGRRMFRYVGEPLPLPEGVDERHRRGGYIHPVLTPSGVQVTEDFPPNHLHHHGIWTAWTSTRYDGRAPDFWNMGDGKGRVEYEGVGRTWSGPLTGGFEARHRYVDLMATPPVTALTEHWRVVAYAMDAGATPAHVFDITVTQRVTGDRALQLPTYRYGGIGLRGRHLWDGPAATSFLTASGRDRRTGHGTRATWAHMSGAVDGRQVGIAVLGHPDNVASPQPMRIHPTEPFFNFAPQQAGPLAIRPGEAFVLRYRFVAFDGPPDAGVLDALWQDWAMPVHARVD